MKKRVATMLAGAMTLAVALTGCQGSTGLETDELTITQYKGVEVSEVEKPEEITDEEVEAQIQSILEAQAETQEITDRAVEDGDDVTIDFVGTIDGVEFDGGSSTDYVLTIGSDSFIDGFEDSIIGHNVGDNFDWDGAFPEDYQNTEYAGKDVTFNITVKGISVENVPELTDELVATLSEDAKTVDEYKAEVKETMEEDAQSTYEDSLENAAWQIVLDNTTVNKYPEDEVKEIADSLIEQYTTAAEYYEMEYADFIEQQMQSTVEDFEAQVQEAAQSSVKQTMVTEAIADKENITLDDETYEAELEDLAEYYGYEDSDALKEAASEEDLKEIVLNNLVKAWITENCVQVSE